MKKSIKNTIATLLVSVLLIAGVMVAGCTQNDGKATNMSSGERTAPALQLETTRNKLTSVLGIPAGGPGMRGGKNATSLRTPPSP